MDADNPAQGVKLARRNTAGPLRAGRVSLLTALLRRGRLKGVMAFLEYLERPVASRSAAPTQSAFDDASSGGPETPLFEYLER